MSAASHSYARTNLHNSQTIGTPGYICRVRLAVLLSLRVGHAQEHKMDQLVQIDSTTVRPTDQYHPIKECYYSIVKPVVLVSG
jgi:hypothetical protein